MDQKTISVLNNGKKQRRSFKNQQGGKMMIGYFIRKEGTHVVLKKSDIRDHLTKTEQDVFALLYGKIVKGRYSLGKQENSYYIVNTDEPYSDKILEVIKGGEIIKVDPNQISIFDDGTKDKDGVNNDV